MAKLFTPDGRYLVVRGRLWRTSDPGLPAERKTELVGELMAARRAVKQALRADDAAQLKAARHAVHAAKVALGERGPAWWSDGAQDYSRRLIKNTPYARWYQALAAAPEPAAPTLAAPGPAAEHMRPD